MLYKNGIIIVWLSCGTWQVNDGMFNWSMFNRFENKVDGLMKVIIDVEADRWMLFRYRFKLSKPDFDPIQIPDILEKYAIKIGNFWLTPEGDLVTEADLMRWIEFEKRRSS